MAEVPHLRGNGPSVLDIWNPARGPELGRRFEENLEVAAQLVTVAAEIPEGGARFEEHGPASLQASQD
jgi:hypothetical protein